MNRLFFFTTIKKRALLNIGFLLMMLVANVLFLQAQANTKDGDINDNKKEINIGILPLHNSVDTYQRGFLKNWNLQNDLTVMLQKRLDLSQRFKIKVFSPKTSRAIYRIFSGKGADKANLQTQLMQYGDKNNYDLIIKGVVKNYRVYSTSLMMLTAGGWALHTGICDIDVQVIDIKKKKINNLSIEGKAYTNWYGITFFGGPGSTSDWDFIIEAIQYYTNYSFGSKEFLKSPIGRASSNSMEKISSFIETNYISDFHILKEKQKLIVDLAQKQQKIDNTKSYLQGEVVDIADGNIVYVSIGRNHNILPGEKLIVFAKGREIKDYKTGKVIGNQEDRVALLKVQSVLADALSKTIVEKKHSSIPIKIGQRIRFYKE